MTRHLGVAIAGSALAAFVSCSAELPPIAGTEDDAGAGTDLRPWSGGDAAPGRDAGASQGEPTQVEACNGSDDDGNGAVDEGCECHEDETQACWPGPAMARGVGACADGVQGCSLGEFGAWEQCEGAVIPTPEVCDNDADDDCDGGVDCDDPDCPPCAEDLCDDGTDDDRDGRIDCADPDCAPAPGACGEMAGPCVTTVGFQSDGNALGASIGWGMGASNPALLDTPSTDGLSFEPAAVGAFGTNLWIPAGAPAGTAVINIPPGGGYNGFFRATFTLPANLDAVSAISLSGAAVIDDRGRAFLNGSPITPSIVGAAVGVGGDLTFCVDDRSLFRPGTNEFLLSDDNCGAGHPFDAGPSGAAFFGTVSYYAAP